MSAFEPGCPVWWLYTTRRGWNWTMRARATVVKLNRKTAVIDVMMANGGATRKTVKLDKLEERHES